MVGAGGKIKDNSASHDSPIPARALASAAFAPARLPKRPANSGRRVASRDVVLAGGGVGWRGAPPRGHCMASRRPALEPGDSGPVDNIEFRHLDDAVAGRVRAFFTGERPGFKKDGRRSVRIAHPSKAGVEIKIKGAGLHGRFIKFGTRRKTGPKAPLFDFDGRMMEDVASGHDNAYVGGASFQQAATEYRMTQLLAALGYKVVPCLGFGKVEKAGLASWFSVFEMQSDWMSIKPPEFSLEEYCEAKFRDRPSVARSCREARSDRLCLVCRHAGRPVLSQGSASFSHGRPHFHVAALLGDAAVLRAAYRRSRRHSFAKKANDRNGARRYPGASASGRSCRAQASPITRRCAGNLWPVTCLARPQSFDQRDLVAVLRGNPITSAMLDLCPAKYERY